MFVFLLRLRLHKLGWVGVVLFHLRHSATPSLFSSGLRVGTRGSFGFAQDDSFWDRERVGSLRTGFEPVLDDLIFYDQDGGCGCRGDSLSGGGWRFGLCTLFG